MSRNYIQGGNWTELENATGVKAPVAQEKNKAKLKVQREKFARCRKCGGQMKYLTGTNVLICENTVEVEVECLVDGVQGTKTVKQICNNINMVDKEYQSYARYLFE